MHSSLISKKPKIHCAQSARLKVSSTFSKVAGSRDSVPGRAPQSAELSLCFIKRRRGSKGEPSPGVPPFICSLGLYVCADTLGGGCCPVLRFDPISLVLAQRNGVEPPKKSAFLPRRLHHSRERYCLSCLNSSSPDLGEGAGGCLWLSTCAPFPWVEVSPPYCRFHPISLLLRKETGWSPKETRFWVPPRGLLGPARLSHGLEAPTSPPTASS